MFRMQKEGMVSFPNETTWKMGRVKRRKEQKKKKLNTEREEIGGKIWYLKGIRRRVKEDIY